MQVKRGNRAQTTPARPRSCRLLERFAQISVLTAAVLTAAILTAGPVAGFAASSSRPSSLDDEQANPAGSSAAILARTYVGLAELRNSELERRVESSWSEHPGATFDALVLRAGRLAPPILSGAARSDREAARAEALALVRAKLDPEFDADGTWSARLERLVGPGNPNHLLRAAALRLAGELELEPFGPSLAGALEAERPELRCAARWGLFALHLRWFQDAAEYESFADEHRPGGFGTADRAIAKEYETFARKRLIELLQLDPPRALDAVHQRDPRVRAASARTLADGVGAGVIERVRVEELLFECLAVEEDALAHQAILDALVRTLSAESAGSPALERLRALLRAAALDGPTDQQSSVVRALGRLPWSASIIAGDAHVSYGLERLAFRLREAAREVEYSDPDTLVAMLRAVGTLCELAQAEDSDLGATGAELNERVMETIESPRHARRVRVAAALLLPVLVRPGDLERVDVLLAQPTTHTDLRYALVGALGRLARSPDVGVEDRDRALSILVEEVRGGDTDLRRRALSPLLSEELAPVVARDESGLFVEWLEGERLPEMQSRLIELIGRYGDARDVELLLEGSFDTLAKSGPGRIGELAALMGKLADKNADLRFRAAERLRALDDPGSEVRRLREALVLVAEIPTRDAAQLSPERHRAIVTWAERFADRGGVALLLPDVGPEFLQRLVELHLGQATPGDEQRLARDAYIRAKLLTVLIRSQPETITLEQIEAEFQLVLDFARSAEPASGGLNRAQILRDRARFYLSSDQRDLALADYREVELTEAARAPGSEESTLEHSDLRDFAALLAESGTSGALNHSCKVSIRLVSGETWRNEAAPARMIDLKDLVERAELSGDVALLARVATLFDGVPEVPVAPEDGAPAPAPPILVEVPETGTIGQGLIDEPARHGELIELRRQLADALARDGRPAEPEPSPGGETSDDDSQAERPSDADGASDSEGDRPELPPAPPDDSGPAPRRTGRGTRSRA